MRTYDRHLTILAASRNQSQIHCFSMRSLLVIVGLCTLVHAQTFKSTVDHVAVPVTIQSDPNGPGGDLRHDDFRVFDDGRPVPIVAFGRVRQAVHVLLLLDISRSMATSLSEVRSAAAAVIAQLAPDNSIRIGTFSSSFRLSPPFSGDAPRPGLASSACTRREHHDSLRRVGRRMQRLYSRDGTPRDLCRERRDGYGQLRLRCASSCSGRQKPMSQFTPSVWTAERLRAENPSCGRRIRRFEQSPRTQAAAIYTPAAAERCPACSRAMIEELHQQLHPWIHSH